MPTRRILPLATLTTALLLLTATNSLGQVNGWQSNGPACSVLSLDFGAPPNEHIGFAVSGNRLFKTFDGGVQWTELPVSFGGLRPLRLVKVALDKMDPTRVYLHDWDRKRVYISTDGGGSWASGAGGVLLEGLFEASTSQPLTLFTSTGRRLLRSTDGGSTLRSVGPSCAACIVPLQAYSAANEQLWATLVDESNALQTLATIHQSTDHGSSWSAIPTPPGFDGFALAASESTAGTLYAVGYKAFGSAETVFKTTDQGTSWSDAPVPVPYQRVSHLAALSGVHGDVLILGFDNATQTAANLVWRSTDGENWDLVSDLADHQLEGIRRNGSRWIARTSAGLFESSDEGVSWTWLNSGINTGRTKAVGLSNSPTPEVLTGLGCRDYLHLSTSQDGGRSFSMSGPRGFTSYPFEAEVSTVDPSFRAYLEGQLLLSTDSGQSWDQPVFQDPTSLAFHFSEPDTLYVATERQGLFRSQDRGATWTQLFLPPNSAFATALGLDPEDPNRILLVSGFDLWSSTDNGDTWTSVALQYSADRLTVLENPVRALYTTNVSVLENVVSFDEGATWTRMVGLPNGSKAPVVFDSQKNRLLLGARDGLYQSHDGIHWAKSPELDGVWITDLEANRYGHIVAGTLDHGVFFLTDPIFLGDFETGDLRHWAQP